MVSLGDGASARFGKGLNQVGRTMSEPEDVSGAAVACLLTLAGLGSRVKNLLPAVAGSGTFIWFPLGARRSRFSIGTII